MHLRLQAPEWAAAIASDLTDMDRNPRPVASGESVEHELPDDVYFQYAFIDGNGKFRTDPVREESARSIWYGDVSVVEGPDYRPDELAEVDDEKVRGKIDRLRLEPVVGDGPAWRVTVYTPPSTVGALPLVIAQDGVAFFRIGRPHVVSEVLAGRGETRPARFAFVEPRDRNREYGYDEGYQRFLAERLEPELVDHYPSTTERIYLGASLGAAASAQAAVLRVQREPGLAGVTSVLAYSGAFLGAPGDTDYYRSSRSWLSDRAKELGSALPTRWCLEVGTLEWLLEVNREIALALATRPDVTAELTERSAGHNWTSWRNGLANGLRFALSAGSAPGGEVRDARPGTGATKTISHEKEG